MPIIVAVNKIDKPGANPDVMRNKLSEHELVPEEWGGDDDLRRTSRRRPSRASTSCWRCWRCRPRCWSCKRQPEQGRQGARRRGASWIARAAPISTILVEEGTLRVGDLVVAGETSGKIRAMLDDKGQTLTEAGPSTPVEVLGLDGVPDAGESVQRRHRREGGQGAGRAPARRAPQEGAGAAPAACRWRTSSTGSSRARSKRSRSSSRPTCRARSRRSRTR